MEKEKIMTLLAEIHNGLSEISVRGDDAIRMARLIQLCRNTIVEIQKSESEREKQEE